MYSSVFCILTLKTQQCYFVVCGVCSCIFSRFRFLFSFFVFVFYLVLFYFLLQHSACTIALLSRSCCVSDCRLCTVSARVAVSAMNERVSVFVFIFYFVSGFYFCFFIFISLLLFRCRSALPSHSCRSHTTPALPLPSGPARAPPSLALLLLVSVLFPFVFCFHFCFLFLFYFILFFYYYFAFIARSSHAPPDPTLLSHSPCPQARLTLILFSLSSLSRAPPPSECFLCFRFLFSLFFYLYCCYIFRSALPSHSS